MELINNNQVPEGYKKTEVGVIPEDWEVVQLKDLIDEDRRITYGIVVPGQHTSNGVPMIRAQDYSRGWVDIEYLYRVSPKIDESYKRSRVLPDDILLTIVGSVGNLAKVPSGFRNTNITQQTARLAFNKKASADFYLNILQSKLGKNVILNYTKSGVQPSLNLSDVEKFNLPYPPLPEQKAIAQTLSDVDTLIDALDKLIAKKRNIKTGTMQQLLTGKTRLPGFRGEWEVKKLGDVVDFSNGKAHENSILPNGKFIVINSKFISTQGEVKKYSDSCFCSVSTDQIVMVMSDVPNGKAIAKCFYIDKEDKYTLNQRICSLKAITVDSKILFYLIDRNPYYLAFDDGVKQTNLRKDDVLSCPLKLPPTLEEQKAIAQVLSDIDSEIATLEKRRAKTQAIKQGIMQELLTGRTRLKIEA